MRTDVRVVMKVTRLLEFAAQICNRGESGVEALRIIARGKVARRRHLRARRSACTQIQHQVIESVSGQDGRCERSWSIRGLHIDFEGAKVTANRSKLRGDHLVLLISRLGQRLDRRLGPPGAIGNQQ